MIYLVNSTLEEEIEENIKESPPNNEPQLFDPLSGEKVRSRKKVMCRLDVSFLSPQHVHRMNSNRLALYSPVEMNMK